MIFPEPPQMHLYLDKWRDQIYELAKLLETERVQHEAELAGLKLEIVRLEQQLGTLTTPFEAEIMALKSDIKVLNLRVRDAERETKSALERLAPAVQMVATAKDVTLDSVIGQVLMLLDEAKKQFRESL
jgi:hypothetical protein